MKIQEKFNKRSAELIEVQSPSVHTGPHYDLGIRLTFYRMQRDADHSTIAMHLTPDEALEMAEALIRAARERMRVSRGQTGG